MRGGGGNFGVVTSFLFKGNPVHTVYGGPMIWPLDMAADLMRFWQDFILNAPDEINGWFGFVTVPPVAPFPEQYHLKKMCAVVWCYTGAPTDASGVQADPPVRPAGHRFRRPDPVSALQGMFDGLYPPGLQWYWRADFFNHYDDKAIGLHVKYGSNCPPCTRPCTSIRSTARRTAWAAGHGLGLSRRQLCPGHRRRRSRPAEQRAMTEWAKDYWLALHPYSAGGGYVNMIMDEGEEQ